MPTEKKCKKKLILNNGRKHLKIYRCTSSSLLVLLLFRRRVHTWGGGIGGGGVE